MDHDTAAYLLISVSSFRVGSITLREFPPPSVKKQMAAST